MIIRKRHIDRRAVLRGTGGLAFALPFFDAMQPALAAEAKPSLRFAATYYPLGVVADKWLPSGEGADFKLSPGLAPLEPFKDRLTVLAGLSALVDRTLPEFHDRALAALFTGYELDREKVVLGPSVDQILAAKLASETQFASLQTLGESTGSYGSPFYRDATTKLPCERNPRVVFERLFGDSAKVDPAAVKARNIADKSALDVVMDRIATLKTRLGPADRHKLDQYLDSIRDVERRIQVSETRKLPDLPNAERPPGEGVDWEENVRMLMDMHVLAWQADLTRVISFMLATESSLISFPQIDVSYQHHEASHHNYEADKLAALHKINVLQSKLFAYWLAKLDAVKEPSGSLLDNSIMVFTSSLSNPTVHSQRDVPMMIAGGGSGKLKRGGRFVRLKGDVAPWGGAPGSTGEPNSTTNLYLSLLDKFDLHLDKMGNSTNRVTEI
jgi:hypothetical protein